MHTVVLSQKSKQDLACYYFIGNKHGRVKFCYQVVSRPPPPVLLISGKQVCVPKVHFVNFTSDFFLVWRTANDWGSNTNGDMQKKFILYTSVKSRNLFQQKKTGIKQKNKPQKHSVSCKA